MATNSFSMMVDKCWPIGGFFGWPNLTLTPSVGFMGMPATNTPGNMRVIDIYRRDGDKLTEN